MYLVIFFVRKRDMLVSNALIMGHIAVESDFCGFNRLLDAK